MKRIALAMTGLTLLGLVALLGISLGTPVSTPPPEQPPPTHHTPPPSPPKHIPPKPPAPPQPKPPQPKPPTPPQPVSPPPTPQAPTPPSPPQAPPPPQPAPPPAPVLPQVTPPPSQPVAPISSPPHRQELPPATYTPAPQGSLALARCPSQITLQRGESLEEIAQRYGLTVAELLKANHLHSETLPPGTLLRFPHLAPVVLTYTVVPGDTLSGIAHRFGLSAQALARANHLHGPLIAGTHLKLAFQPGCGPIPQVGLASWYGPRYAGRPTASGLPYNPQAFTAASPTLPLGSIALVTNLRTHQHLAVFIDDRGPAIRSRILDLSYAAAKQLGALRPGLIPVRVEVVWAPHE